MTSSYPMADVSLGLRFALSMVVQVFLPGWLLAGRRLTGWDGVTRVYAALASGLLLQSLLAPVLSFAHIPLSGWVSSAVALGIAAGMDRLPCWRRAVAAVVAGIRPARRFEAWVVVLSALALLAVVLRALAGFSAPPHLYDASNHAFVARRILEVRSLDPDSLFNSAAGALPLPYLLGWHVTAATSCDLSGLAPYIACWYLSVLGAVLLPLGLNLFWRAANVGAAVASVAAPLAVANYWVPTGLFAWGGFGMILGLAIMPWTVVLARAAIHRPSVTTATAAAAALVGLLHVHTSEVFTAAWLLIVAWPPRGGGRPDRSASLRAALAAATVLLVCGLLPVLPLVSAYAKTIAGMSPGPRPSFGEIWLDYLHAAAGGAPALRWLAPLAWLGILVSGWRRMAAAALAVAVVYLALRRFGDPLSGWLTQPYYHQWPRLLYGLIFLVPPLVVAMLALPSAWLARRTNRRAVAAVNTVGVAALLVLGVWPGLRHAGQHLARQQMSAPFTAADVVLAQKLAHLPPLDGVVANLEADGSFWAMHASGRTFLDPCGWELAAGQGHPWRAVVPRLAQRPWPPEVKAMQAEHVAFLLVSDHLVPGATALMKRADLAGDPRFEPELTNDQTTLYRIRWDREP